MVDFNFLWLFGKTPGISDVSHPIQATASEIYSDDGKLIGRFFRENRTPVAFGEISPLLCKALVSTEDERFYQHFGIDVQGLFAAAKDMMRGDARGASTITQQLVKNLFKIRSQYSVGLLGHVPGLRLLVMKSKEWILAVKIEMFYTKKEILEMYFNTVDFGSNAYGIKTACHTYFNTTPAQIKAEEAATLVGLLKATTTYNPRIHPEKSLIRRNVVLENMRTHHALSMAECDSLKRLPIRLHYSAVSNYSGDALYFREAVENELETWCKENDCDLYADGLKIYTTLDSRMQRYAEEAVRKQMRRVQDNFNNHWGKEAPWRDRNQVEIKNFIEDIAKHTQAYKYWSAKYPHRPDSVTYYLNLPHKVELFDYENGTCEKMLSTMDSIRYMERFMHCGFVAMEPQTGHVKAWVGDIDYHSWKYDKVLSKRQPGSTFKLFVYTAAMNEGLSPCDERIDDYISWEVMEKGKPKQWVPRNANGSFTGDTLSLKAAFARSINTVAVQIAKEVGIDKVAQVAKQMGIVTPLEVTPALSLGASDVSLLELVNAYGTVVDDGKAHVPVLVTRVEDRDGKVLYEAKVREKQVLPYETAFLMTEMLKGGLSERGGTSQALWGYDLFHYDTDFGGKTGTSSNHSDAWFVGVTPHLVGGAWVGGEYRSIHFRTGELGQGSRTALPVFAYFMEEVLKDKRLAKYRGHFPKPKQHIARSYNCRTIHNPSDSLLYLPTDSLAMDSVNVEENGTIGE